jgi:hypothetical protein
MHRGYVPEQLETIFLTALEEGTSGKLQHQKVVLV